MNDDDWKAVGPDWLDDWLRDELPQKVQEFALMHDREFGPDCPDRARRIVQAADFLEACARKTHAALQSSAPKH